MITDFTSLSDEAKIWIYPSSRKFYTNEIEEIDTKIKAFVERKKRRKILNALISFYIIDLSLLVLKMKLLPLAIKIWMF